MRFLRIDLTRRYPGGETIRFASEIPLDGGSISVLFGPSGAGKSTILRCLAGLDRPDEGFVHAGEVTWFDAQKGLCLPPQKRGIGYLFQDPCLFPHMRVEDNIGYGLSTKSADRSRRARDLIERLGLSGLERRFPHELSGGQQQRVALARALAPQPGLLLLDEPLSALDTTTRTQVRSQMRDLINSMRIPVVMVTHDRHEASLLGDQVHLMRSGSVISSGPPSRLFSRPPDRASAEILGMDNLWKARVESAQGESSLIRLGSLTWSIDKALPGGPVDLGYWAEDVSIRPGSFPPLVGKVRSCVVEGPVWNLDLDCGMDLVARVRPESQEDLPPKPGSSLSVWLDPGRFQIWPIASR